MEKITTAKLKEIKRLERRHRFFQAKYRLEESVVRWWSRLPIRPWWIRECREGWGSGKDDYTSTFEMIKKRSWSKYDESLSRTFWRKKSAEKFIEMMNDE